MYFAGGIAVDDMGYAMSRLDTESDLFDDGNDITEAGSSNRTDEPLRKVDDEIAQLTNISSGPPGGLCQFMPGKQQLPVSPVRMLAGREGNFSGRGRFSSADCCHMLSRYLPVHGPWLVDQTTSRAYVSQFSADGSLFVAGFQGSNIRIYDVDKGWKVQKNILAKSLRWTVTDTSLSPDQRHLVYTSISPIVHIVNVGSATIESHANVTEIHEGLDFISDEYRGYSFGIFSVKFSTDGRELVAGSSDDSIYVYDLEANKLSLRIVAHTADVNTVTFADESGNLIYSGSDDNLCKVWDRRCFIAKDKPAGVLMGHLEGITFVDSRGDGRYFISNGKDQTIKLWDIRKMSSDTSCNLEFRNHEWDYRWMDYPPKARDLKHPCDQSVATYKGHSVLRTLIRCYFSPKYSTGQRYIYTGSHDSQVYIYDVVTGAQVAVLKHHTSPVRDCSWHPYYPMLVSSSWDGDVVKWEFPATEKHPPLRTRRESGANNTIEGDS
ncbi:LEC14B protein-like isoform X2 [Hibiscus syriacus]|uniref:LEC14B protein-like isoform X2 n=1 Tax=Hibiscus syriacus TaxID=106335 RepID=UPI0019223112|nr:LEC14B protein-like isoform X2 [Hibiscus syriacus]